MTNKTTVIFGYGPVGRLISQGLLARGESVRIAQRSRPADLPSNAQFASCDILDRDAVRHAVQGVTQVVLSVGFPYDSRTWRTAWPTTMNNIVEVCADAGVRLVFIDNLYQIGPQDEPKREDMPLSNRGNKPAIRAEVTRIWQAASDRVRVAALRSPDFYGPGVGVSQLGSHAFGQLAKGNAATLIAPPDTPHDFAYVPDVARAAITLLDAPDDAYGQVWNMPCAPTRTPREILLLGADAIGVPLKVRAMPLWLLPVLAPFSRIMKEVMDVGFTFDRPYVVDATKFKRRFWADVTPFEVGAPLTAQSFASSAT
jgi:nucleoside-diphosphate-sugar epimerase